MIGHFCSTTSLPTAKNLVALGPLAKTVDISLQLLDFTDQLIHFAMVTPHSQGLCLFFSIRVQL